MKLFTNEFARVDYAPEPSLIETVWMPRSSELSKENIKAEMNRFLDLIRDKRPRAVIADTRYFGFKVDQELQQWIILHYISEIMEMGVKRYAILVSEEVFKELNKDAGQEENYTDFEVKYFTSHPDAFRWVTSRKK